MFGAHPDFDQSLFLLSSLLVGKIDLQCRIWLDKTAARLSMTKQSPNLVIPVFPAIPHSSIASKTSHHSHAKESLASNVKGSEQ